MPERVLEEISGHHPVQANERLWPGTAASSPGPPSEGRATWRVAVCDQVVGSCRAPASAAYRAGTCEHDTMNARVYRPCLYKIDHSLFRFCATRMSGCFVSRRIAHRSNRNWKLR